VTEFVYGLTELFRERVSSARFVANPGCFATGAILALAPLASAGGVAGDVVVNGVTGSSGSGAEPRAGTHHPERDGDFRAYRVLSHQHVPEIEMALRAAGARSPRLAMVPHSAPLVRGIFTTACHFPAEPIPAARLSEIYAAFAASEPFLRMRETTPRLATVRGTNFCDLAVAASPDGRRVVVMSAIDNLVKGMAGQAVQNLNLMFGRPETEGLGFSGMHP
jgi:N-acetyl-gamma-glutamyl-phosphate reductase